MWMTLLYLAALAAPTHGPEAAKKELSINPPHFNFKDWEGTYHTTQTWPEQTAETEIEVQGCNPQGCSFRASASFEVTVENVPPGGGGCEYSGEFKFIAPDQAVAWNSKEEGDFRGEFPSLAKEATSDEWKKLVFIRKGNLLSVDNDSALSNDFCARNSASFIPAAKEGTSLHLAGPSFDCAKAKSEEETTICAHAELARLDKKLSQRFRKARASSRDPKTRAALIEKQRAFLEERAGCKSDVACLKQSYLHRLSDIRLR
jgi:uncharacterized protein YecT (DUF1311 family)